MEKIKNLITLACKEVGWEPESVLGDAEETEKSLDVGGAKITQNMDNEDEYIVELFEVGDRSSLKLVSTHYVEGANLAVAEAMKHLVYHFLIEALPID